jgi:hypothetical protein
MLRAARCDERRPAVLLRDDVRWRVAAFFDPARSRRAFERPARVSLEDWSVGVAVRLRERLADCRREVDGAVERLRVAEPAERLRVAAVADRLRVATPVERFALRARRGCLASSRRLRLVLRPMLRVERLRVPAERVRLRDDERFDLDVSAIAFPLVRDDGTGRIAIAVPDHVEALAFRVRLQ